MVAFHGHYDGKVLVPDEPLNLVEGQRVLIHIEVAQPLIGTIATSTLAGFAGILTAEEGAKWLRDVQEGCEKVDEDGW